MRRAHAVEESPYGLYVWRYQGKIVADSDGNVMNIPAVKGDLKAMTALRQAATYYGVAEGGEPVFLSNRRRVTDGELRQQEERQHEGLIADPYDYMSHIDEYRERSQ